MRNTKKVKVGNMLFGDGNIYIQSMLNTRSDDVEGSVAQALALEKAGCEVVRAAIPDEEALALIPAIKEKVSIPSNEAIKLENEPNKERRRENGNKTAKIKMQP